MSNQPMISRAEAAQALGITEQSVIYWEQRGYITRQEDGRRVVYEVREVVEQAKKNPALRDKAAKLAAEVGILDAEVEVEADVPVDSEPGCGSDELARKQVEIDLLRERVEAQEREIERLHQTMQRLAQR